jgi:hypothetical protein
MKQLTLLSALLFISFNTAFSQSIIETVQFDYYVSSTDNDFVNHFTGGAGLTQITTNGITGGCLVMPTTLNWGNDNAIYCSKYVAADSSTTSTRISFKYDTTQINTSNSDRAVSIFLRPNADFNHYIIASVNYNKRLQILTYSWANSPPLLNLQQDHWYQFLLNTSFVADSPSYQINISAMVNDLGLTGQFPPIPVGFSNGTIYDSLFYGDTAVQVSIIGASWGGAKYLDNFHFEGIKSNDSCSFTTAMAVNEADEFKAIVADNRIIINNNSTMLTSEIYSMAGQKMMFTLSPPGNSSFSIAELPVGIYLLHVGNERLSKVIRFAVLK